MTSETNNKIKYNNKKKKMGGCKATVVRPF